MVNRTRKQTAYGKRGKVSKTLKIRRSRKIKPRSRKFLELSEKKVFPSGFTEYRNGYGELHRLDGPAVIHVSGLSGEPTITEWYRYGKKHRDGGPAYEDPQGTKYWFKDGKLHRLDGPAMELPDGTKIWYKEGKRHRTDGPAVTSLDGYKGWWVDDKLHNLNGPAVESPNGSREWWINGNQYPTEEAFEQERRKIYKNILLVNYAMARTGIMHPEPVKRIIGYSTR